MLRPTAAGHAGGRTWEHSMTVRAARRWGSAGLAAAAVLVALPVLSGTAGAQTAPEPTTTSAQASATPTATMTPSSAPGPACTTPLTLTSNVSHITPGLRATLTVSGAPVGAEIQLYAYSRPGTTFQVVREATTEDDTIAWDLTPGTNTRVRAFCKDQPDSRSNDQVVTVRTALSLTVVRNGVRNYTFQGRILPRRPGQLITLYRITDDGDRVLTSQIKTDDSGAYVVNRIFSGSGTFGFLTRTGQTLDNAFGESNSNDVESGLGRPRPTAIF